MKCLIIYLTLINVGIIFANSLYEPDQDDLVLLTTQIYDDYMIWSNESGSGSGSGNGDSGLIEDVTDTNHSGENHTFVDFEDNSTEPTATDDYDNFTDTVTEGVVDENFSGSGDTIITKNDNRIMEKPQITRILFDYMPVNSEIYSDAVLCSEAVDEYMKKHPDELLLKSQNFPNPYPNYVNQSESFTVYGGIGINITVHCLDLDPKTDFLHFRAANEDYDKDVGPILTGSINKPIKFLVMHSTQLFVRFVSQHEDDHEFKGYALTYSAWGDIQTTPEPEVTEPSLPINNLETIVKYLAIQRNAQVDRTWGIIRSVLTMSATLFVQEKNINASQITHDNVLFVRILGCPEGWQDNINCVAIEFGIPLILMDDDLTKYELSAENLEIMWSNYSVSLLSLQGITEYVESTRLLLIWISISLAIVAAFLCVLYAIWRTDIFKDYRRMSSTSSTLQLDKDEATMNNDHLDFDVSMYPSPYQKVPTLFPANEIYGQRVAHTGFESYQNPEFIPDDFKEDTATSPKYNSGNKSSMYMQGFNRDRDESMS